MFLCNVGGSETFLKLLDFGIAKSTIVESESFSATKSSVFMGTPYYMSPEQIVGAKHVDLRTDLWSLGVVVFEMLTGEVPFKGDTLGALTLSICTDQMRRPTEVNRQLAPEIDAWFERACARDRNFRFTSASEFSSALAAAIAMNRARTSAPPITAMGNVTAVAATGYLNDSRSSQNVISTTSRTAVSTAPRANKSSTRAVLVVAGALVALGAVGVGFGVHFFRERADADRAALNTPAPSDSSSTSPGPISVASSTSVTSVTTSLPSDSSTSSVAPTACAAASASAPSVIPVVTPPKNTTFKNTKPTGTDKPDKLEKSSSQKASCDPPFVFDADGNKVFKKECLQ
jgi:serine/threonine protein kinase